MGVSKPAALIMPRGDGVHKARQDLYGVRKGMLPVLRETQGGIQLPLVHQYKHLGGMLTHTGNLLGEIRHRLQMARATFKEAKRTVFCLGPRIAAHAPHWQVTTGCSSRVLHAKRVNELNRSNGPVKRQISAPTAVHSQSNHQ